MDRSDNSRTRIPVISIEKYCFDEATGFLRRRRTLRGATEAPDDVLVQFLDQDPVGAPEGNVDRERYFGGDGGALPESSSCTAALPGASYVIDHSWAEGRKTMAKASSSSSV